MDKRQCYLLHRIIIPANKHKHTHSHAHTHTLTDTTRHWLWLFYRFNNYHIALSFFLLFDPQKHPTQYLDWYRIITNSENIRWRKKIDSTDSAMFGIVDRILRNALTANGDTSTRNTTRRRCAHIHECPMQVKTFKVKHDMNSEEESERAWQWTKYDTTDHEWQSS